MICNWFKKQQIKRVKLDVNSNILALIVGHNYKEQGAFSKALNQTEYELNKMFALDIQREMKAANHDCRIIFRDDIGITEAYKRAVELKPGAIIELHFNAYDAKVSGCETLYCPSKEAVNERMFAATIHRAVNITLGNKNRGLKTVAKRAERGFFNLSRVSNVPSILIEPFFGDNEEDALNFKAKQKYVARDLALAVINFFKEKNNG